MGGIRLHQDLPTAIVGQAASGYGADGTGRVTHLLRAAPGRKPVAINVYLIDLITVRLTAGPDSCKHRTNDEPSSNGLSQP